MAGMKYGSEKQIQAVTNNMKEEQYLDKKLKRLSLEESYAKKLIQLDNRMIKVNYKRLKERVSKIRSYLKVDEIAELKTLELEGRLKPAYTQVNLSGVGKIQAAAKRLKIEDLKPRAKSAYSGMLRRAHMTPTVLRPQAADTAPRPNSVTGVFIDEPEPNSKMRRLSVDGAVDERNVANQNSELIEHDIKIQNTQVNNNENKSKDDIHFQMINEQEQNNTGAQKEAITNHEIIEAQNNIDNTSKQRPSTTIGVPSQETKKSNHNLRSRSSYGFSSHNLDKDKSSRGKGGTNETAWGVSSPRSARRLSIGSNDSMDGFGPNPYEERRQNLLENEKFVGVELETHKAGYLTDMRQFIKSQPPVETHITETKEVIKDIDSCVTPPKVDRKPVKQSVSVSKELLERRISELGLRLDSPTLAPGLLSRRASSRLCFTKQARFADSPMYADEALDRNERISPTTKMWREMKKIRYLRVRNEDMDITGVVTLATDQLNISKAWKDYTKKRAPFKTGLTDDL